MSITIYFKEGPYSEHLLKKYVSLSFWGSEVLYSEY